MYEFGFITNQCLEKLKDNNTPFLINWDIESTATSCKEGGRRCSLRPKGLLNKRTELISKCRHRNKFLLCSIK